MARPSNFKGQVVAQGGECRKFALWLKHCSLQGQLRSPFDLLVSPNLNFQTVYRGSLFGIFFTYMQRSLQG